MYTLEELNQIGAKIIGAAFDVRNTLGQHLTEKAYEEALQIEQESLRISSRRQVHFPVEYKGHILREAFRIDLLVEDSIIVELKALPQMGAAEIGQITAYLNYCQKPLGYLINFHAPDFKPTVVKEEAVLYNGIYRFINSSVISNKILSPIQLSKNPFSQHR